MRSRKQKLPPTPLQAERSGSGARTGEAPPAGHPALFSEIAGFQVGRKLGVDADADLYLGRSADDSTDASAGADQRQNVTLKLFRADAASSQSERELAVRTQLAPGTVGALLDVATVADGRVVLVLEHLAGGSLLRYLRDYSPVSPGEAVTILAPLVLSLTALHDAGFALPDLAVTSIALTAEGRPVIDRWGALQLLPPSATDARLRQNHVRNDYGRLIRVMREVFAALEPTDPMSRHGEGIAGWGEEAADHLSIPECLAGLEHALFEWAPAEPLRMRRPVGARDARAVDVPLRRVDPVAAEPATAADGAARPQKVGPGRLWHAARRAVSERNRLRKRLTSRPVLVAVALATGLIALALTALSTADGTDDASAEPSRATNAQSSLSPAARGTAAERAAISSDDPVAASVALLTLRSACLAESSVLCLDNVDQAGSAAMAADRYAVRMAQQSASEPPGQRFGTDATLVERNGDSALIEIERAPAEGEDPAAAPGYSKPASLLVIRGEAGWRVREIFDY
ncbi:hypothetical protein [Leifsonia kafniensis]|uniref:hypothetical protein n=1 Tax=Leifsonia kafniensis TaxID=475957 RepID=UPI0031E6C259